MVNVAPWHGTTAQGLYHGASCAINKYDKDYFKRLFYPNIDRIIVLWSKHTQKEKEKEKENKEKKTCSPSSWHASAYFAADKAAFLFISASLRSNSASCCWHFCTCFFRYGLYSKKESSIKDNDAKLFGTCYSCFYKYRYLTLHRWHFGSLFEQPHQGKYDLSHMRALWSPNHPVKCESIGYMLIRYSKHRRQREHHSWRFL